MVFKRNKPISAEANRFPFEVTPAGFKPATF